MLTGTNLTHAKQYNLRIVYETIRLFGPLSRAEVARRSELTAQTISNLVKQLVDADLVVELDRQSSGRGAPSIRLQVNPDAGYAVGLDLDQDHLTAVLVDLSGAVRQRSSHVLGVQTADEVVAVMGEEVTRLLNAQKIQRKQVWGVGIGVPGPMYPSAERPGTYVVNPRAFPAWTDVPIGDLVQQELGLTVFVENNATAAAIGERWYGDGQHIDTFFYLYFGSGLGGGLIINGRPFHGHSGNAGEVGFLPVAGGDAAPSHMGELFNLPRLFARLQKAGTDVSELDDLGRLFASDHPVLIDWLDAVSRHLVTLLIGVELTLDPATIFFGGRIPDSLLVYVMERVEADLPAYRMAGRHGAPSYQLATSGADAAALGVATLPIYDFFAPVPRVIQKGDDSVPKGVTALSS